MIMKKRIYICSVAIILIMFLVPLCFSEEPPQSVLDESVSGEVQETLSEQANTVIGDGTVPISIDEPVGGDSARTLFLESLVTSLTVADLPNDSGDTIRISWQVDTEQPLLYAGIDVLVYRSETSDGEFKKAGETIALLESYDDAIADEDGNPMDADGKSFFYKVQFKTKDSTHESEVFGPVVPQGSWFDVTRINALLFLIGFSILILGYILAARSGKELYIRKVAGLASVDEAVGRATEMGRKILYVPGIAEISEIQTVAGLSILGHIAKTAAEYSTRIIVPNMDPLTYAAAREIVHESYLMAGRPDAFREEDVYFITSEQFAYTAAVTGYMVREKPAANFFIGWFKAESLMLAETGQSTGAIQIAGTAELDQLPFFVATCDHTLMGEELYAASAYLTRMPLLLGSIKGQDIAKAILLVLMFVGIVLNFFQITWLKEFLAIR